MVPEETTGFISKLAFEPVTLRCKTRGQPLFRGGFSIPGKREVIK